MSLQIRTYVNQKAEYIELYDNEEIRLEVSFAEIQDITKKNSAYTKEFKVPGTKTNNRIFNYFFDFNSVPLDFIPKNKFTAQLLYNGYEIQSGFIRLNNVTINKTEKIYSVTFYSGIGDIAANIKDKFLSDIDLSDLNHKYTYNNIVQSQVDYNLWDFNEANPASYQDGRTFFGLYNIGYIYGTDNVTKPGVSSWRGQTVQVPSVSEQITPLLQFSGGANYKCFDYTGGTSPVNDFYFVPSLQIRELYTRIFNNAGYSIDSNFFDTSYFKRFYLPLKFADDSPYNENGGQICFNFTPDNIQSTSLITPVLKGINVNPPSCNNFNWEYEANVLTVNSYYQVPLYVNISFEVQFSGGGFYSGFFFPNWLNAVQFSGSSAPAGLVKKYNTVVPVDYNQITGRTITLVGIFVGQYEVRNIELQFYNDVKLIPSGTTFDYSLELQNTQIQQLEFITSVNKLFNLVCVQDNIKQNTIRIEPMVDYLSRGQVLDWTSKINFDDTIQVQPTTDYLNGTLNFNLKVDGDYTNQQYQTRNSRIFGTTKVKLDTQYKDTQVQFDTIFSPHIDLPLYAPINQYITLPNYCSVSTENREGNTLLTFKPIKILPKLVFRGLTLPNGNWGDYSVGQASWFAAFYPELKVSEIKSWQSLNRFTTYPFSLSGFSHYCNFNSEDIYDLGELYFPDQQDLYDLYYNDYITDITSDENKIVKAKMILSPYEVQSLTFDEVIMVKGTKFRINKISNIDLTKENFCDVELIKITKDYQPHPIKYFQLSSCTDSSVYYTHTDLNYNMFAYKDGFVKIYSGGTSLGCYRVSETGPIYDVDYQELKINLWTGDTSVNSVGIYTDCNCTTEGTFGVINQTDNFFTGVTYDYYTAVGYSCPNCDLVGSTIVAFPSGESVTIGRFYPDPTNSIFYQITGTSLTMGEIILTTTTGSFISCAVGCSA